MPTRLQVVLSSPFETWVAREIDPLSSVNSEVEITRAQLIKILTREVITTAILNVRIAPASKTVIEHLPKGTALAIDLETEEKLYGLTVYHWGLIAACLKYPFAIGGYVATEFVQDKDSN